MLAQTLVLDDASGDDISYALIAQNETGTRRIDVATDLAYPRTLQVKHSVQGGGVAAVDRHLVQFSHTLAGADGPVSAVVNFTIAKPRDAVVTNAVVFDLVANLVDFLSDGGLTTYATTANVTAILRGES